MRKIITALVVGGAIACVAGATIAQTISPRRLLEVADLGNPVVSPDGRKVAFRLEQAEVDRNTYDATWYVQDMDGASPPRPVGDGGIPLRDSAGTSRPSPAVWSPDGRWIYYKALLDGKVGIWRAAADGSSALPVTHDAADVRDFALSADGKTLKYSVGASREEVAAAEQQEYDHGIRIDASVPIGQPLFRSGLVDGRLETQRYTGKWFSRAPLLANVPARWKAVDVDSGATRDIGASEIPSPMQFSIPPAMPVFDKLTRQSANGRLAVLTRLHDAGEDGGEPSMRLTVLPATGSGRPIECVAKLCKSKGITDIQWMPAGDAVLFTITDRDFAQSIARWDVANGEAHIVASSHGLMNGGDQYGFPSPCGVSSTALVCVVAEADKPPRLERIDLETGDHRVLFDPNAALAKDLARLTPAHLLRWTDSEGRTFTGQFFRASVRTNTPPPLFVNYYSCQGFLRGGVGNEWPFATLAELGISALCINSPPIQSDAVKRYDLGLSAVESVVSMLAARGAIDPKRVGMGGLSFGTEVAIWVATHSDLLAAVSVTSPSTSQEYYLVSSLQGKEFLDGLKEYWGLGAPDETPERWKIISPVFRLDRFRAPLLFQMPEQEFVYTLDYTIPLMREHRADVYLYPNEPHQKFQPVHKLAAYERNVDWFRFWLQGYVDPDPAKAAQYSNWRLMAHPVLDHAQVKHSKKE